MKKVKDGEMTGYCVRCKAKRKMVKANLTKSKNGRNMVKGHCRKCDTKMCKFLANNK